MRRILTIVALLALFAAAPRAHAESDRVSFFHDITIDEGEQATDTVCIFCSIRNEGAVHGDAVSLFGGIHSSGSISGDAVSILGNIKLDEDAHVGGDTVAIFGMLRYRTGQIGGETVEMPVVLLLIPLGLLALLIWGIRSIFRPRSYSMPPWRP